MEEEIQLRSNSPFGRFSYIYCGTIAVIASWVMATVLTGCRIGNYSQPAPTPDPVTGYYDANPATLEFCATGSTSHCAAASTTLIPAFIAEEVTNPLALILNDATTGDAFITAASNGKNALPVWVATDNSTLYYANSSSPQTLWRDVSCKTTTYLQEEGKIVPGPSHSIPGLKGSTQGSLTLKVQVIQTFDGVSGSCGPELQAMSNCYQDISQCGGGSTGANQRLQAQVQSIFTAYIQAGVMTPADIPNMNNVAYEAHYQ